jgi:hypothetical protein
VAVAGQLKCHPDNLKLTEFHSALVESIKIADWEKLGVDWLVKLGVYNP